MITVSNIIVVQGTGTYVDESVLEVTYTLASDQTGDTFDMQAQLILQNSHPTPMQAYLANFSNPTVVQIGVSPGTFKLLIRVPMTLTQGGINPPFANYTNELIVQVRAQSRLNPTETSAWAQNATPMSLIAAQPVFTTATMPQYIGGTGATHPYTNVPVTLAATSSGGTMSFWRISQASSDLIDGNYANFRTWGQQLTYSFSQQVVDGMLDGASGDPPQVLVRGYDQYYNGSALTAITYDGVAGHYPTLQKASPTAASLRLVGSVGNSDYTGINIDPNTGFFSPNRAITAYVSADSPIPMTFTVLAASSNVEQVIRTDPVTGFSIGSNVGVPIAYSTTTASQPLWLTVQPTSPSSDDYNQDVTCQVSVRINDAAGNMVTVSEAIRLNTRIYYGHNAPMQATSANYQPILQELSGTSTVTIPQSSPSTEFTYAWQDIFYPLTHSYPTDQFGNLDQAAAVAMNQISTATNDAVVLTTNNGVTTVLLDANGLATTTSWTYSKTYSAMLSSRSSNLTYWTIDNQQWGDFTLTFEYFDLNPNAFGPPYNNLAPYRGDMLVIYDASAPGALSVTVDPITGNKTYTLLNSSLLTEIATYTGGGTTVMNLTTGQQVGSNAQGGFTTATISGIPQVVMILYTDASGNASGFKLKGSPEHQTTWSNWDLDPVHSQVWVHKNASLGTYPGAADGTVKQMIYNYADQSVTTNMETGQVTFSRDMTGNVITADYSYYNYTIPPVNTFVSSYDDLVAFDSSPTYVLRAGAQTLDPATSLNVFEADGGNDHGRITTNITWDTDRGVVEINNVAAMALPSRRIIASYYYHTYKRLTNDGYDDTVTNNNGDLRFHDQVIVADSTTQYPSFTWADVKFVNEGDAILQNAQLTFVPRGIDVDGIDGVVLLPGSPKSGGGVYTAADIVDRVLNINMPWDIQMGTQAETYASMACAISTSYIWSRGCFLNQQPTQSTSDYQNQDAGGILGYWVGKSFPNPFAPQTTMWGRVVWVLGDNGNYVQNVTSGEKRCGFSMAGTYYTELVA